MTRFSRRQFLKLSAAIASAGIAADSLGWEPYHPRLIRVEMQFPQWPVALNGFRIIQLSDLHYDPYFGVAPIEAAVRLAQLQSPDLVVLTGDFVTLPVIETRTTNTGAAEQIEPCARLLAPLLSKYGSYAVLGNHDQALDPGIVTHGLQGQGIEVLRNRALPIDHDGARFFLAGVDDVLAGAADLDRALKGVSSSVPVVLLAHEPDFADHAARFRIGLQLSGHSHGGQIRFPLMGPLYLPRLSRKYPQGFHRIGDLSLYTNVGIGTIHIPMRWNCAPEVTLIILRCGGTSCA